MKSRFSATGLLVLALAGCSTPKTQAPPDDPVKAIAKAAMDKVDQMPAFTASADGRAPAVQVASTVTMSYYGEAKALLRQVASARNMEFKVQGPKPYTDLYVAVDAVGVPFNDFLADVGHQLGQKADVILTDGAILIRYRDHR